MWRLTSLFCALSLIVSAWLLAELGMFSSAPVMATEKWTKKEIASTSSMDAYQRSLIEKNKDLEKKEAALAKRELEVAEKEKILTEQLGRYESVIQELKGKLGELEKLNSNRTESFRKVYEKMDPKKAAQILEDMELDLAAQIVSGMKQDRAADILGAMSRAKARQVTERCLGHTGRKISSTKSLSEK